MQKNNSGSHWQKKKGTDSINDRRIGGNTDIINDGQVEFLLPGESRI